MNTRLQIQNKTTPKSSFTPLGRSLLPQSSTEQAEPPVLGPILHDMLPKFQAKLTIGQPNDQYEQEADRVADQVMRMPEPRIQRVCPECEEELQRQPREDEEEEETLQTKPLAEQITPLVQKQAEPMEDEEEEETLQTKTTSGQTSPVSSSLQHSITALRGGGQPLPKSERAFFEPRFGTDFSQVRIHADSQAAETASAVNARAFTLGQDIVFGTGQYQPSATEGRRLLAHELTHVMQQNMMYPGPTAISRLSLASRQTIQRVDCSQFRTRSECEPLGVRSHPCVNRAGQPSRCRWSGSLRIGCICPNTSPPTLPPSRILEIILMILWLILTKGAVRPVPVPGQPGVLPVVPPGEFGPGNPPLTAAAPIDQTATENALSAALASEGATETVITPRGDSIAIPAGVSDALSTDDGSYRAFMSLLEVKLSFERIQTMLAEAVLRADPSSLTSAQRVAVLVPTGRFHAALEARIRSNSATTVA